MHGFHHCPVCSAVNKPRCIQKGHYALCDVHRCVRNPRDSCPQCDGLEERKRKAQGSSIAIEISGTEPVGLPQRKSKKNKRAERSVKMVMKRKEKENGEQNTRSRKK